MDKKKLLALIAKKNERKTALVKQTETCEDVATLRSFSAEMDTLNEEIRSLQELADSIPDADDPDGRTAAVTGQIPGMVPAGAPQSRAADTEGMEYRKAFMQYVTRGVAIPAELRAGDENTLTTDVGSAIPTVVVNQIIEKMETFGIILPLVTRTSYAAGVAIPTSTVKPVASWVSEGAGSDRQKKTTGTITFSRFKLRCEISMSMEVSVLAVSAFEAAFVRQVSEAMVKAIEGAIISTNNGATTPKGILAETPESGQAITADTLTYELLCNIEAAIPSAYETGAVHVMTKKTFMAYVGMTDSNGQPVARITYGIGGLPERSLLGRPVVVIEGNSTLKSFASTLTAGDLFHFVFNFSDYVLNTAYDMGIQRKQDWDTEDMLTKAVMSVDGKVVDKNSLVTVKKKA
jgi:HK97 family phage major capsid protein